MRLEAWTAGLERTVRGAPLCPAGHLPLKGGDWLSQPPSPIINADGGARFAKLLISPLEGEMPGRAERGASQ
ncbi:assimilatory nitrate reductase (NADH) subunit alpha [Mesorhizobium loti]|nr:assimilatory nitrate reductase (NADH) subunit alpha [Mesorhizobium loti]